MEEVIKKTPFQEDVESELIYKAMHFARVLVIPMRMKANTRGRHKSRGVFVLIFGYGELVDKEFDLIVVWSEGKNKSEFDYLPFKIPVVRREGHPILTKELTQKFNNKAKAWINRIKLARTSKRKPISIGIHEIMETLQSGKGFWRDVPLKVRDKRLTSKYLKKSILKLLPLGKSCTVNLFLSQMDCYFLLLRDVYNVAYNLDSRITPDPYSVVRNFLRFIGVFPERRGGKEKLLPHP